MTHSNDPFAIAHSVATSPKERHVMPLRSMPGKAGRWPRPAIALGILGLGLVAAAHSAVAQTYNEAIANQLAFDRNTDLGCKNLVGSSRRSPLDFEPLNFGPQLAGICGVVAVPQQGVPGGNSASGTGASVLQLTVPAVQERLLRARKGEEEKGGGASADDGLGAALTDRLSIFASTGYRSLDKNNTKYEDGYDSGIVTLTVGADYQVTDWFVAGAAFNYANFDGNYDDSGNFEQDSYGGILYGSFTPVENAFVEVVASYAGNAYDQRYDTFYTNEADDTFGGRVHGDYNGQEVGVGFQSGYDFPIENFTIGPRFGLNWLYTVTDNYAQNGNSGLELVYYGDSRSSLQTNLGIQASMAIGTGFGVLVPQIGAAWIHEYLNDSRNQEVRFAQDYRSDPTQFTYKREKPVRNWGVLNAGVSAVLPHDLQPFVNFTAFVGNNRYTSYGGTLGLRVGL